MLTHDEDVAWLAAVETLPTVVHLAHASDALFTTGTLDPKKSGVENAQAVFARIGENMGGCGDAHLWPASMTFPDTVYVHFGPPPGCTLTTALAISGAIGTTVEAKDSHAIAVAYFSDTIVDSDLLLGKATFKTDDGSSFMIDASVTHDREVFVLAAFTMAIDAAGVTLDGPVTAGRTVPTQAKFGGVRMNGHDCRPSAGTIDFVRGDIAGTIAFSGGAEATVTIGAKTTRETLPPYGACR
jgi:hypothetical protein